MPERNWEAASKDDAYLLPPNSFMSAPATPDRIKGAPILAFACDLYAGRTNVDINKLVMQPNAVPMIIQGSKEGMKELVCRFIDDLWRASHV